MAGTSELTDQGNLLTKDTFGKYANFWIMEGLSYDTKSRFYRPVRGLSTRLPTQLPQVKLNEERVYKMPNKCKNQTDNTIAVGLLFKKTVIKAGEWISKQMA